MVRLFSFFVGLLVGAGFMFGSGILAILYILNCGILLFCVIVERRRGRRGQITSIGAIVKMIVLGLILSFGGVLIFKLISGGKPPEMRFPAL